MLNSRIHIGLIPWVVLLQLHLSEDMHLLVTLMERVIYDRCQYVYISQEDTVSLETFHRSTKMLCSVLVQVARQGRRVANRLIGEQ